MIYIYDIEAYKYLFCVVFYNITTEEYITFEISKRKNQYNELCDFCKTLSNSNSGCVGFNNLEYDYPLLHAILLYNLNTSELIHQYSNTLISNNYNQIPYNKQLIHQLDLYKIHHFDNKNRATSLKALEIAMRSDDIIDLPFELTKDLYDYEIEEIIKYCKHDVSETYKFFLKTIPLIELRETLSKEYNLNLYNDNDPKLGSEIFLSILSKELNIPANTLRTFRTYRPNISLKECVLDKITFTSIELNTLLDWIKSQNITETKNVFSEIDLNKVIQLLPHCNNSLKNNKLEQLNIIYDNLQYNIGLGGIHACIDPGVYESNDDYMIVDVDVISYYPNLAITNKFYPEHLSSKFCDIYEDIFNQRVLIPKKDPRNYAYKILLNGVYGFIKAPLNSNIKMELDEFRETPEVGNSELSFDLNDH